MGIVVEVVGMCLSAATTMGFVAYRVGKLEGVIIERLNGHERRLEELEGERRFWVRRHADSA